MGGQNQVKVTKGHEVQIFKVYFWGPMQRKNILHIMGGQNQVKVTKGHQVHILKNLFLSLYA